MPLGSTARYSKFHGVGALQDREGVSQPRNCGKQVQ
jgi:hypothetical protein